MELLWIAAIVGAALLLVAVAIVRKQRGTSASLPASVTAEPWPAPVTGPKAAEPEPEAPRRIVVASGEEQVLALSMLDPGAGMDQLEASKQLDTAMFGRALEPLMQVAPSMVTAGMAGSTQLMEVVINGPLVAASDGNGFRAITMGAKGVQENARLFEPTALQNVAKAAAIWQLASVVVAQKHLADISATLKRVEEKVAGVQSLLEEQRAALIQSAMNYISVTRQAMQKGEYLERTRDKLEGFEIRLEQAGLALLQQIRRESGQELESDMMGCEGEYKSALAKHRALVSRVNELVACAEVRLANWYLCSLYPDRSKMLEGRMALIQGFMRQVGELQDLLAETVANDCLRIDAAFTSDETIAERRAHVKKEAKAGAKALTAGVERCSSIADRVEAVNADRATPARLLVEIEGGTPKAIYLSHQKPLIPPLSIEGKERVACR